MTDNSSIYTGAWISYSKGQVLGGTITLKTRDATIFLAFLTLVVTIAGSSFWNIISYLLHQLRRERQDVRFIQQQAILKNSSSGLNAAISFYWLYSAYNKVDLHTFLFALTALAISAGFGTASIFSSRVVDKAGAEFLLRSPNCGHWNYSTSLSAPIPTNLRALTNSMLAASYANNCYGEKSNNTAQCGTYVKPQITWATTENATCPFPREDNCLISSTSAYQMDTGLLDSHADLGLNAKSSDRISIRKIATCAPLATAPYLEAYNLTVADGLIDKYIAVNIGPSPGSPYTFSLNTHKQYVDVGYDLVAVSTSANYIPIPDFNTTDADISLFFLTTNSLLYLHNTSDPFYSAIKAGAVNDPHPGEPTELFYDPYLLNTIGCIDQYQFCNPAMSHCTQISSLYSIGAELYEIGYNKYQLATAESLAFSMFGSSMYAAVGLRGPSALEAQKTVYLLMQEAQLPSNQWQIEVSSWFAVSLAALQMGVVESAVGPTSQIGGFIIGPQNDVQRQVCNSQMIRDVSGYQNFSTLGVILLLVFGTLLFILSLFINDIGASIQYLFWRRHQGRLSWISDGYLQLQRLAYESAGYEGWEKCDIDVPIWTSEHALGVLDIIDKKHPRLVRSEEIDETFEYRGDSNAMKMRQIVETEFDGTVV